MLYSDSVRSVLCDLCYIVPTGVPSNLTSSAVTPRTINITWYAPPYPDLNGLLTQYTLTYQGLERDMARRTVIIPTQSRSNSSLTVTDLEEDTTFNITIQAHTIVGAGPVTWTTVLTPEDGKYRIRIIF